MADCVLWQGAISNTGYGQLWKNGKQISAHRHAWMMKNGDIPRGMFVLHKCDIKACVNFEHLYIGNRKDNARDAIARGQMATGERHGTKTHPEKIVRGPRKPNARYTMVDIKKMRELYQPRKWTLYALAKRFGGSISSISRAVRGESYVPSKYPIMENK